jgi:hypothetical protein
MSSRRALKGKPNQRRMMFARSTIKIADQWRMLATQMERADQNST